MDKIVKKIYKIRYEKDDFQIIIQYFNKFCNCRKGQIYIKDNDAYGEWIHCAKCKIWLGWRDNNDYFDIKGVNIKKYYRYIDDDKILQKKNK